MPFRYQIGERVLIRVPCLDRTRKECPDCWYGTLPTRSGGRVVCRTCHGTARIPDPQCFYREIPVTITGCRITRKGPALVTEYQIDTGGWVNEDRLYERMRLAGRSAG